jgi:3-deoxy-manno-octulosonate cytidylyltransferase (CMP-KDO synthetase)
VQKAVAIIPARYNSTRFPGKPLATLHGKTIIHRVFEQVSASNLIDSAYIATDDKRIYDEVNAFGGRAVMTSPDHTCGTDRIAEAAEDIECDIIINVQGDEPFIRPEMVDDTVKLLWEDRKASMSTLAVKIKNREDMVSPHVVKVVMDNDGYALYFSRFPVPYHRDIWENLEDISFDEKTTILYKHIGIYGFRKEVLMKFTAMGKSRLEDVEKLEQLRALASGLKIKVKETQYDTFGIDTIEDLRKAEEWQSISL